MKELLFILAIILVVFVVLCLRLVKESLDRGESAGIYDDIED